MLSRFQGEQGIRLLGEALLAQKLIAYDQGLVSELSSLIELREVKSGDAIIEQFASDNDIYLIIHGLFGIYVNGRLVNKRGVNDHVGEMAAIDPSQLRAATVRALENSVVAVISEPVLATVATKFPQIYRRIAKELAARLHQRNAHVGSSRDRIKVFVISSVESLPIARAIQSAFGHDNFLTTVWTDGVFKVAGYPLQNLFDAIDDSDFAVAIAHGDDRIEYREENWPVPRDNVVFELGLFMGRLGKDRAILMEPRNRDVKLPSDLAGVTTVTYRYEKGADTEALLAPACNALRKHILQLGPNI